MFVVAVLEYTQPTLTMDIEPVDSSTVTANPPQTHRAAQAGLPEARGTVLFSALESVLSATEVASICPWPLWTAK